MYRLTNLFSLDFVLLQNSRNFASIFLGSLLISGVNVWLNLSTTATHTIKLHIDKEYHKILHKFKYKD